MLAQLPIVAKLGVHGLDAQSKCGELLAEMVVNVTRYAFAFVLLRLDGALEQTKTHIVVALAAGHLHSKHLIHLAELGGTVDDTDLDGVASLLDLGLHLDLVGEVADDLYKLGRLAPLADRMQQAAREEE